MGFVYSNVPGGAPMPTIPGGYQILWDSGLGISEANPENGPVATVKFRINDYKQRYSFVQQMLGLWTGAPPSNITYQAPAAYPPSPNLLCTAVPGIQMFDKPVLSALGFPWVFGRGSIVTCVFTRPPWQAATNQGYFSIQFSCAGETYPVPATALYFGDGTPSNVPNNILVTTAQITVTRFRMPFLPDAQAAPLYNTVNNAPFAIGWNTYAAETLFFAGMDTNVESDPLGNISFTVAYKFLFSAVPWNYGLYPTGGWQRLATAGGAPQYALGNFTTLP